MYWEARDLLLLEHTLFPLESHRKGCGQPLILPSCYWIWSTIWAPGEARSLTRPWEQLECSRRGSRKGRWNPESRGVHRKEWRKWGGQGTGDSTSLPQSLYKNTQSFPRINLTKECSERQLFIVSHFLKDVTTLIPTVNIPWAWPLGTFPFSSVSHCPQE